jgi:hypothetical protein
MGTFWPLGASIQNPLHKLILLFSVLLLDEKRFQAVVVVFPTPPHYDTGGISVTPFLTHLLN